MKPAGYPGVDNFNRGDCYQALNMVDSLAAMWPLNIVPFVDALRKLHLVVCSSFENVLHPDFREHIAAFESAYQELGISITPKIHISTRHVSQFCENKSSSLTRYSEQLSEAVQSLLKIFWQKRKKINNIENPRYEKALKDTLVEFKSKHI